MTKYSRGLLVLGAALVCSFIAFAGVRVNAARGLPYTIVDTGQKVAFDDAKGISSPRVGDAFWGQDANYLGNEFAYKDNGDGTVTDLNTGLTWVKARGEKMTWRNAVAGAEKCRVGGYDDWRAPTIKELYSLIDFNGVDVGRQSAMRPFINTRYFGFKYGDSSAGERVIDCQDWSATKYTSVTMRNNPTAFGVNFADGRIKGYGITNPQRGEHKMYMRYVRGNPAYGKNKFVDNGDGTITDQATGLTWQKMDSKKTYDWKGALKYANSLQLAGHDDWRLPNAKELQSIVDYARSPKATNSAAIDPIFGVSKIESYYWSSTTHKHYGRMNSAVYISFGRAMGYMRLPRSSGAQYMDVHGAGAQRAAPKSGDPCKLKKGRGPQGDEVRINNYVRCVRGGAAKVVVSSPPSSAEKFVERRSGMGDERGNQSSMDSQGLKRDGRRNFIQSKGQTITGTQSRGQGPQSNIRDERSSGQHQGPPPEALNACQGKEAGDACAFEAPHGTVRGTCADLQGQTACKPKGMRGPGGQGRGPGRRRQ